MIIFLVWNGRVLLFSCQFVSNNFFLFKGPCCLPPLIQWMVNYVWRIEYHVKYNLKTIYTKHVQLFVHWAREEKQKQKKKTTTTIEFVGFDLISCEKKIQFLHSTIVSNRKALEKLQSHRLLLVYFASVFKCVWVFFSSLYLLLLPFVFFYLHIQPPWA